MTTIDWSKAPPHATHWCPGNAKIEAGWIYNIGGEFYSCYADTGLEHLPEFPAWRESRLIRRPPKQSWTGEGLPPVGIEFEFTTNDGYNWHRGSMLFSDSQVVLLNGYQLFKIEDPDLGFRPIRTPEQIEAEERNAAQKEIEHIILTAFNLDKVTAAGIAGVIADSKYRKQVTP